MKRRILITPLYGEVSEVKPCYYFNTSGDRTSYCDAFLSAEASCKYVLANEQIDEIITFGTKSTYDPEDGLKSVLLGEGRTFYETDIRQMSTYSLFRYRLAEYLEEINIEAQDLRELLDEESQKNVKDFINAFFRKHNASGSKRFNRFFDHLMRDEELRNTMLAEMEQTVPGFGERPESFTIWTFQYLYGEMKDSSKLEILEGNSDVKIRFIPVGNDGTGKFIENFTRIMRDLNEAEDSSCVEIFMCIQSDDVSDTFVMMNIMNLIKAMPDSNISIAGIITTTRNPDGVVSEISDDTEEFSVTDLLAGIRAFLRYGKTDMLIDYWNSTGIHNSSIERLLYAMRNIDTGISLCDISDIERGIDSLRELFSQTAEFSGSSFAEKFFAMIAEGIRRDYGTLLKNEDAKFIDLVKWAYRKGFWQQTLTLIESRAPKDFVNNGFYYYSNSPSDAEAVVKVLGQVYYDLKPFEKYKLEDIPHYYVKFYSRWRTPRKDDSKAYQMEYAKVRMSELDTTDPEIIRAHTICPDKDALKNLLFSYYYLGDVRNATNHAEEEFGGFSSIMHDSDIGARMNLISQSIDYFIHCYDVVADLVAKSGEKPDVNIIDLDRIVEYSKSLRPKFPYNGDRNGDRRNDRNRSRGNDRGPVKKEN
ncbi:MAG: hypothetical protein IJS84_11070 [Spirochaetales bacterium]|nr:hypothetical protein [Spirochaetales bacterium]